MYQNRVTHKQQKPEKTNEPGRKTHYIPSLGKHFATFLVFSLFVIKLPGCIFKHLGNLITKRLNTKNVAKCFPKEGI